MKNSTEKVIFQFDDNYKDIISNSSIVRDFDKFIEMANNGLLELTKMGTLSMSSSALVNESISKKISVQLKRPGIKSFPNVLSLFILFNFSGLRKNETKGKKNYLIVNQKMLEQWNQFSDVEKYFNLFSLLFANFNFEPINEKGGSFEVNIIIKKLTEIKGKWGLSKRDNEIINFYQYKTILTALDMFSLVDIEVDQQLENQGWKIKSIESKDFMIQKWAVINQLRTSYYFSETDDIEEKDDYTFDIHDIEEFSRIQWFSDKISEQIPEFSQRLKIEMKNRSGIFYFKAIQGKAWRMLKVDSHNSLDNLCFEILKSFDFEFDHLYDISFLSSFGYHLTFNGAPEISFAEFPTTNDISIGNLPINISDKMILTFDYGDNWKFSISLEKIENTKINTDKTPEIKVTEIHGKSPEQYPCWD